MRGDATQAQDEDRFYRETGPAARVADLAEPVIKDLGMRLVRVLVSGRDGCTVQIMADKPDGIITIEDCALISRRLSPVLDVEEPVAGKYRLEVSSPGIDRPLVRLSDFADWTGYEAKVELKELIDGRKRFKGVIEGVEDSEIRLLVDLEEYEENQVLGFPVDLVESAKLIMTDALIKASLAQNKTE